MRICLDAGHGVGARGGTPGEHELVLRYTIALKHVLLSRGHEVRMTRENGRDVTFARRVSIANSFEAECFISMHANGNSDATKNGVWLLHAGSHEGRRLATDLFTELRKIPGLEDEDEDQEVFQDGTGYTGGIELYVLQKTNMPAAMVELGFMTNRMDREQLESPETVQPVCEAIADGIEIWAGLEAGWSGPEHPGPERIEPEAPHIIGSVEDGYDPTPFPVEAKAIEIAQAAVLPDGRVVWTAELDALWKNILAGPIPPVGFACNGCTASFDELPISGHSMLPACIPHDYHYSGRVPGMSKWWGDTYFLTNGYRVLHKQGCSRVKSAWVAANYFAGAKAGGNFGHFTPPPS